MGSTSLKYDIRDANLKKVSSGSRCLPGRRCLQLLHRTYHDALRQPLYIAERGWTQRRWVLRTPAMAAGITDHRWTVLDFLRYLVPPHPPYLNVALP